MLQKPKGRPKGIVVTCAAFAGLPTCRVCQQGRKCHMKLKPSGCKCPLCASMEDTKDTQMDTQHPCSKQEEEKTKHLTPRRGDRQRQVVVGTPASIKKNTHRVKSAMPFETHAAAANQAKNTPSKRKRHDKYARASHESSKQRTAGQLVSVQCLIYLIAYQMKVARKL